MINFIDKLMETTVVNVNCIRDKFSGVSHLIYNNLDIFAIAETKPDSSFPETQFILSGMRKPFLLDVTSRKGGLLVFIDNDIPPKYLQVSIFLEIYKLFLLR